MPITAELHDGRRLEFPDGTDPSVVQATVKRMLGQVALGKTESPAFQEGRQLPGAVRGLASVAQGPTLGFADEIAGAVGGGLEALRGGEFGPEYRRVRDMARGAAKQEAEDNPIFSTATQLAAGAPALMANPVGSLWKPVSMAGRAGLSALQGLLFGSASGAGQSTAETPIGVAADAAKSGATSAAFGAVASPVSEIVGKGVRTAAANVMPGVAENYARQKVAEALVRDAPKGATTEQVTGRAAQRLSTLGPEARVIDVGGQNTRQLADTLATLPGATKQAAEEAIRVRQAGRGDRLIGAAQKQLNPAGVRLAETVDDLVAQRAEAAKPLYDALYQQSVQPTAQLREIVAAADKLGAGAAAKRMATASRSPYSLTTDAPQMGMRDLDQLKQGLDDIIGGLQRSGNNKEAAAVIGLKNDMLKELDSATKGAYKAARDAFSGPSALIDAATTGRKALSMEDTEIARLVKGMSQSEAEAFRVGAAEALRAKLGTRAGQTGLMDMWREPATQEKLKAIFGSEREFRQFAADLARERRLKGIESVGRGSQTAARQYGAGDLDLSAVAGAAQTAGSVASGNVPGMLAGVASAWNRVKTPEPVRDRMGALLLLQGQQGRQGLLDIENSVREVMNARIRNAGALGAFGSVPGSALGKLMGE